MPKLPISVIIHTKNSEGSLETALKSVLFAEEIVVIDMQSTDRTIDIAKNYQAKVFEVDDVGFADPMRNFGISKASCDWILVLDSDEEVRVGFEETLRQLMLSPKSGWWFPRKNIIFDKWIKFSNWWPDYQLRFFPKGTVSWTDKVHTDPIATIETIKLDPTENNAIIHHHYPTIESYISRLGKYTGLETDKNSNNDEELLTNYWAEFFRHFKDINENEFGQHELALTMLQSTYQTVASLKKWEKTKFRINKIDIGQEFAKVMSEFKYYYADFKYRKAKGMMSKLYWRLRRKFRI